MLGMDFASRRAIRLTLHFAPPIFFFFLVGRYWVDFAPPGVRKLLGGNCFGGGGGAKWPAFRPGGGTLFVPGGALFSPATLRESGGAAALRFRLLGKYLFRVEQLPMPPQL
jgi:hypothetical protein